ncbi:MAG: MFS transporter [Promethearchaeota archaeon]
MSNNITYDKRYTQIFIIFYFAEGLSQGVPYLFWKTYVLDKLGSIDLALWLIVYAIGNIPWVIKAIVGVFNDRWGSKKLGRRFPWVVSFGTFGGAMWIMMAFYLPLSDIYVWLAIYYFTTQLGMAFADSALDGMILDVTPKDKLSRVQGYTWTMMFVGYGAGGMLLGLIFLAFNIVPLLFLITGVLNILACFLTYFVKEPPLADISTKEWGKDLLTVITKKRNWKVYLYTTLAGIQAVVIIDFFMYVVLVSMGELNVSQTILSLSGGGAIEAQIWFTIFYLANGVGIFIGAPIAGKLGDKSRKKTASFIFLVYIPFLLIMVIPFLFNLGYVIVLILGIIFLLLQGGLQNGYTVVNQTIRGDLSKKYYPNLKSTYFAILVALANLGQNIGTLIGASVLTVFAALNVDFFMIFFVISAICSLTLFISFLVFKRIPSEDYELEINL